MISSRKENFLRYSKEISAMMISLKSKIMSIILHGSSLTQDFNDKLSDLGMVVVARKKTRNLENNIFDIVHNTKEYG